VEGVIAGEFAEGVGGTIKEEPGGNRGGKGYGQDQDGNPGTAEVGVSEPGEHQVKETANSGRIPNPVC